MARQRNRPVANRWIGQRIADPDIDLAAMARAQGCVGIGPVQTTPGSMRRSNRPSPPCAPAASRGRRPRRARLRRRDDGGAHPRSSGRVAEASTLARPRRPRCPRAFSRSPAHQAVRHTRRRGGCGPGRVVHGRPRRVRLHHRPVRLRQEHPVRHDRRPGRRVAGTHRVDGAGAPVTHPNIGMVFQEESTFPWRTVLENVALPLEGKRMAKSERRDRAAHFVELVGLRASKTAIRTKSPAACASAPRSRARSPTSPTS